MLLKLHSCIEKISYRASLMAALLCKESFMTGKQRFQYSASAPRQKGYK